MPSDRKSVTADSWPRALILHWRAKILQDYVHCADHNRLIRVLFDPHHSIRSHDIHYSQSTSKIRGQSFDRRIFHSWQPKFHAFLGRRRHAKQPIFQPHHAPSRHLLVCVRSRSLEFRRGSKGGEAVSLVAGGDFVLAKRRECPARVGRWS